MTPFLESIDDGGNNHKGGGGGKNGPSGGAFAALGLSPPVLRGIKRLGYRTPTPVQRKSLPVVMGGNDVVVMARTGSGKTAAFLIPVVERLLSRKEKMDSAMGTTGAIERGLEGGAGVGAVILSPTRELSQQTLRVLRKLTFDAPLNAVGINGGESMEKQFSLLSSRPDVIVATPGRLAHHLSEIPDFTLQRTEVLVLDEADRLFELGFAEQMRTICSSMPSPERGRQTLLFSATMPKVLVEFTRSGAMGTEPDVVRLDEEATVSGELRIGFVTCRSEEREAVLLHLLRDVLPGSGAAATTKEERDKRKKGKKGKKKKKKDKGKNGKGTFEDDVNDDEGGVGDKEDKDDGKKALGLTLIFAATKHHVDYLVSLLNASGLRHALALPHLDEYSSKTDGERKDVEVATGIYGTLDQVARDERLRSFRSGHTPILVVTDVAARGIDVPLIDHVVHYAFPSTAKLFVHRSGRAARAGRVGYAWGLVDAEEGPYMCDLCSFLGRRLSGGRDEDAKRKGGDNDEEDDKNESKKRDERQQLEEEESNLYTLDAMTPSDVHYGSVPESALVEETENVRRIVHSELQGGHDAEVLRALSRVCDNAMKQYRKTRPEASPEGVRRAKAVWEGRKVRGGERVGGGRLGVHPVLRKVELERMRERAAARIAAAPSSADEKDDRNKSEGDATTGAKQVDLTRQLADLRARDSFLKAMSTFRPRETVFETFSTSGKKSQTMGHSQVDKGQTTGQKAGKGDAGTGAAVRAMKGMRRQMRISRDKGTSLVVAGSDRAKVLNGEEAEEVARAEAEAAAAEADSDGEQEGAALMREDDTEGAAVTDVGMSDETRTPASGPKGAEGAVSTPAAQAGGGGSGGSKRRLSKAERRRLKKNPNGSAAAGGAVAAAADNASKPSKTRDYRDHAYFISDRVSSSALATEDADDSAAEARRSAAVESAMLPSSSSRTLSASAGAASLRLEDAALDLVGDESADLVLRRRMMRWDKAKRKYVQSTVGDELGGTMSRSKRVKLESGRVVMKDKVKLGELYEKWQKKTNRSVGRSGAFDDDTGEEAATGGGGGGAAAAILARGSSAAGKGAATDKGVKVKNADQIRKERKAKANLKRLNMKKEDRRRLERKERAAKNAKMEKLMTRGYQGKKGFSGRFGGGPKGGGGKRRK